MNEFIPSSSLSNFITKGFNTLTSEGGIEVTTISASADLKNILTQVVNGFCAYSRSIRRAYVIFDENGLNSDLSEILMDKLMYVSKENEQDFLSKLYCEMKRSFR